MALSWGWAATLGMVAGVGVAEVAMAQSSLQVVYPPADHQTTAAQIFFIGTADPSQPVLINGVPIADRSPAGHFAPSLPLELGPNQFTLTQAGQTLDLTITRLPSGPTLPDPPGFVVDSLWPQVNVTRQPDELICLSAIGPASAMVTAQLANQPITLLPQATSQLPSNAAVLVDQNNPVDLGGPTVYRGCMTTDRTDNLGQPTYRMVYQGRTETANAPGQVRLLAPNQIEVAEVTAEAGVARTGPSTSYSRLTPLPQGTRAQITGREGDWLRLDYGGWIRASETQLVSSGAPPQSLIRGITSRRVGDWTEVSFPLQVPVPVSVHQTGETFTLTLHNTTPQTDTIFVGNDGLIKRLDWRPILPNQAEYTFHFATDQQWGYTLRYEGTTLILSLKHPPRLGRQPLQGTTILIDPGHGGDELGARGPNGIPEKAVNLDVSLLLQAALERRGATVIMTRTADSTSGPNDRAAQINRDQPTLALSIHYNALPDSGDALNTAGIGMFWFHAQAHDLAQFLHDYLVTELDRPSYGVFWNNLALTRPHVAPSVLLELGFMINPTEFEWIVNPQAQEQLAETLADGVAEWVQRQGRTEQ
jgi:N-acetylmuramoyl-L-alanine amidase